MARLVGTAGHVDHGKTSLIRALTGIDADRLPEERQRGMTIDIGFAYLDLPEVGRVSIVDVPGHEKFLSNMLVGAQGIDVALLCVAADAGVMPQTREHLQILELLPVERLAVALTRADLVDEETLELAKLDVLESLVGSRFADPPMVAVSAVTGQGLEELRALLAGWLKEPRAHSPLPWQMPIDRVFSVKGHGVVVTGTLAHGEVTVGSEAVIMPGNIRARVRSLHSHEEPLEKAESGRRVAMNLGGIKAEEVNRGMLIGEPGALFETEILDAKVHWIKEVKHATRVRVSLGSDEVIGKVYLNDEEPELVQLRLERPTAASIQLPVIIRLYSPPELLAGGHIVVPLATKRKRTEAAQSIRTDSEIEDRILDALAVAPGGLDTPELVRRTGAALEALSPKLDGLLKNGDILGFAGVWFTPATLETATQKLLEALGALHEEKPTQPSHPREWVVKAAGFTWHGKPLERILAAIQDKGLIHIQGAGLRLPDFRIALNPKQSALLGRIVACLDQAGVSTPNAHDLSGQVPAPIPAIEEMLRLGLASDELVRVDEAIYYSRPAIEKIRSELAAHFGSRPFTVAECRDHWQTSRKYVVPLLEYFDAQGFTVRQADQRVVRNR